MSDEISINNQDITLQIKLDCQIPELIARILTRKIINGAADQAGIEVENEELQAEADRFRLVNQLTSSEDTQKWLDLHHLSRDDFGEIIYNKCLAAKLADRLFREQIEPYFFARQLDYTNAVIFEIILQDPDLAIELYYAICERETSFDDVAREYIQDKELRRQRGYRGLVTRKDLKPEISAAVFAANAPEILKPIATSVGIHLIAVEEIVEPELDLPLRDRILDDLFTQWLEQQIALVEFKLL